MVESNPKKKVGFSLPEGLAEKLRKTSKKTGLSQSKIVTELLDTCLEFFTKDGLRLPAPTEAVAVMDKPQAPDPVPPVQLSPEQLVPDPTAILERGRQPVRLSSPAARQEDKRSHLYQIAVSPGYESEQDVPGGVGVEVVDKYGRVRYEQPGTQRAPQPVEQAIEYPQGMGTPGGPGYTGAPVNTNPGYTGPPVRRSAQEIPQQQISQQAVQLPPQQLRQAAQLHQPQPQIPGPGYTRDPFAVEMVARGTPGAGALRPAPTVGSLLGGDMPSIGTPNPNMEAARQALGPDWRRKLRAQTVADRREE
jgi:hypothetical protein